MRYERLCAAVFAFLMVPVVPATLRSEESVRCPPSKTWTTGPEDETGLVLAEGPDPVAERIAGPFDVPWSVALLPDGSFLVTERPGHLQHVRPGADTQPVSGIPDVLYVGHGGLLDIAVDPEFADNRLVYMSYLQGDETASSVKVLKARYEENDETLTDEEVIFESSPGASPELLGGRLALTGDGYLFLSLGDRWEREKAQDLSGTAGTIVRIRTDGTIPEDNPFRFREGARPEIWSYGHRNPQGLAFDRATGELWSDEHGPQGGDELNLIRRGANYGWPIATFGVDYSGHPIAVNSEEPGTELPVHYWVPISIAPSGLAIETGPSTTEMWIGALGGAMVVQLDLAGNCTLGEHHLFKNQLGRIRDVRVDTSGALYVLTDGSEGALYRVELPHNEVAEKTHL